MKKINGLLNKVMNIKQLELETFDLIDVFSPELDEQIEQYKTTVASLEIDVSKGVIPFPTMTRAEINTWKAFCPQESLLKEYKETMPVEVAQLAKICLEKGWFYKIQVWSEHAEDIDPVLVGVLNDSYSSPLYLLARWGASLKPYEQVREIAANTWKRDRKANLTKKIKECQRYLEDLDEDSNRHFSGDHVYNIY